jgi:LysR family transcriptional regulator (chromosome initiation inhibitor)
MYDYKLLEALDIVIKERSFQKAAARLFITQSAVSQRIKQLEGVMGQPLIVRSPEISPTTVGQQCIAHFRQVRLLEEALARKCARGKQALAPTPLDVAVNTESLSTWFIGAVKETLLEGHLLLRIFAEDQEQTINLLRTGKVWGCVTSIAEPPYGCTSTMLGTMVYHLVCTPDFRRRYFGKCQDIA